MYKIKESMTIARDVITYVNCIQQDGVSRNGEHAQVGDAGMGNSIPGSPR